MVTPELRCPTTPATLVSTSFCATVVPTLGSAWSSNDTSSNTASLPPIFIFSAFASSIARRAPFSLSLPRWAMPPVSGATLPITTSTFPASPFLSSLQPEAASAINARTRTRERIMTASGADGGCGRRLLDGQYELRERVRLGIVDGPVRRHRDGSPYAGRSPLDLGHEVGLGVLARLVFRGDVLVRGP